MMGSFAPFAEFTAENSRIHSGGSAVRSRALCIRLTVLCLLTAACDEFDVRRSGLLAAAGADFVDDPFRDVVTPLDDRPFQELLKIVAPFGSKARIYDDPGAPWQVSGRVGGRPFLQFDQIRRDGVPIAPIAPSDFDFDTDDPALRAGLASDVAGYFARGKGVNGLRITHRTSREGDFPTVVTFTADGFFNIAGARAPLLLGSAFRVGFIGPEPFVRERKQHIENVDIITTDPEVLRLVFDVRSEAGEGVIDVRLLWDAVRERPMLSFRSALAPRLEEPFGFAGFDFLRGPTLEGLQAFHDARSAFLVHADGSVKKDFLVPPALGAGADVRELAAGVAAGSKLVLDQPQRVGVRCLRPDGTQRVEGSGYFTKCPDPSYDQRADLILELGAAPAQAGVRARIAQVAANLADVNPEAQETCNVFLAHDAFARGRIDDFAYSVTVDARDFERDFAARPPGVAFVRRAGSAEARLVLQDLDRDAALAGTAMVLNDASLVIDPRRPSTATGGAALVFDAADPMPDPTGDPNRLSHRIFFQDLTGPRTRLLTSDPLGRSSDVDASVSPDGALLAFLTTRMGSSPQLVLSSLATTLVGGFGMSLVDDSAGGVDSADFSPDPARHELAFSSAGNAVSRVDLERQVALLRDDRPNPRSVDFSMSGEQIAFASDRGLRVVQRDGSGELSVAPSGEHPTWIGDTALIVQRGALPLASNLVRVDVETGEETQLTSDDLAAEPSFVPPVAPMIAVDVAMTVARCQLDAACAATLQAACAADAACAAGAAQALFAQICAQDPVCSATLQAACVADPACAASVAAQLRGDPLPAQPIAVLVAGRVGSSGAPSIEVNGARANVKADAWSALLMLAPGPHRLVASALDTRTGLSSSAGPVELLAE